MKPLIVFYSFEGNTKLIAEKIAQTVDAEALELKPQKEIRTKGFMKYFWGGKQVLTKVKSKQFSFLMNTWIIYKEQELQARNLAFQYFIIKKHIIKFITNIKLITMVFLKLAHLI